MSEFPSLFHLDVTVPELLHRGHVYQDVSLRLFKPDPPPYAHDYDRLIEVEVGEGSEASLAYRYAKGFIDGDLFTAEEVEHVTRHFERYPDVTLSCTLFTSFPARNVISLGAVAVGGTSGFWMFDRMPGFDCPVQFWGHYDIGACRRIAQHRTVHCQPDGTAIFADPSQLCFTSENLGAVQAALVKAAATGTVQTLKLKLALPRQGDAVRWAEDEDAPF